ncbi:MAG: SMI1/KNR4 family protein [Cyclobacteriaceae bacterium]|nr:SMI1/KNR4 family protein [Cyclobacteriaceae bacterium]
MLTSQILKYSDKCIFNKSAELIELERCEKILGMELPKVLRDLLLESNGIQGEYGLRLLWTIDEIIETNTTFRTNTDFKELYMPFDNLLFFADGGNGDQFGFSIISGQVRRNDIFVWNHENDSREWVAPDLLKYFEWWLSGQIKI